jgi:anti-sigma factor RsiW
MNCSELENRIDDYLDGELDPSAAAAVETHVKGCERCATAMSRARLLGRALADYPVAPPADGFSERVVAGARKRRSMLPGRIVAIAFVASLMLSVVTVILTGLSVKAPRTQLSAALPTVTMQLEQPRTVNLVFDARAPLDDVTLLVTVPRGVEIDGYPGRTQLEWRTSLEPGKNVLPLDLVARSGTGGQLVAQLGHGESRKIFRVHLDLRAG